MFFKCLDEGVQLRFSQCEIYFKSVLWVLCLFFLPDVSWLLCGSSSRAVDLSAVCDCGISQSYSLTSFYGTLPSVSTEGLMFSTIIAYGICITTNVTHNHHAIGRQAQGSINLESVVWLIT